MPNELMQRLGRKVRHQSREVRRIEQAREGTSDGPASSGGESARRQRCAPAGADGGHDLCVLTWAGDDTGLAAQETVLNCRGLQADTNSGDGCRRPFLPLPDRCSTTSHARDGSAERPRSLHTKSSVGHHEVHTSELGARARPGRDSCSSSSNPFVAGPESATRWETGGAIVPSAIEPQPALAVCSPMRLNQLLRGLARMPLFTGIAVLTLAIGIGANTAIFSVIQGVLLKPLPYPRSDELVALDHSAPGINLRTRRRGALSVLHLPRGGPGVSGCRALEHRDGERHRRRGARGSARRCG